MAKLRFNHYLLSLIGWLALSFLGVATANAQVDAGTVAGTVKDRSGAMIPASNLSLKGDQTGVTITTHSSASGEYAFNGVAPGRYTLTVECAGFATGVTHAVDVHVQQTTTIDVVLALGAAQQEVVVTAAAPLLQSEDASIGQTITGKTINDLPLETR